MMGKISNMSRGVVLAFFLVLCVLDKSGAVWLNLPATGTKCVSEEIHNNVVVLADYVVISDDHTHPTPSISAKVCVDVLGPRVSDLCTNLSSIYSSTSFFACSSVLVYDVC